MGGLQTSPASDVTARTPAPTDRRPALSLSHVSLYYEHDVQALHDVTLDVPAGQRVCVLGANGSGKSTLASVLCGLLAPDEGSVELVGERVFCDGQVDFDAYQRARRNLGLVFQNPDDQIVTTVVEEDVAFGPENLGIPSDEIGRRVERELHRMAMEPYAKADPTRLSGGQQQRVAIAGALAMEPQVIVFDEPGALLDVRGRRSILHVMDQLQRDGITQVHVTHFMEEALAADRVLVMSHGSIVLDGTADEVFSHQDVLDQLGLEEPFAAQVSRALRDRGVGVAWTCEQDALAGELAAKLREPRESRAAAATTPGGDAADAGPSPIVSCEDVGYRYTGVDSARRLALQHVSFRVARGSTCAIVGQTGSGKSTLVRLLCALEVPDAGRVTVDGHDTADKAQRRLVHGVVGYVMQHPERQLFAQTVAEDVAYGPRNLGLDGDEVARRVRGALDLVGLRDKDDVSPFELSGGQKRLCAIAGVLAMEPAVLVLDEPTAGLDPRGRSDLRRILRDVNAQGVTVIQVTHSMEDAARCDQVVVLNESQVLMQGTPREVFCPAHERLLHDSGLGLPQALAFAGELEDAAGLPAGSLGDPLTVEELVDAVCREGVARC